MTSASDGDDLHDLHTAVAQVLGALDRLLMDVGNGKIQERLLLADRSAADLARELSGGRASWPPDPVLAMCLRSLHNTLDELVQAIEQFGGYASRGAAAVLLRDLKAEARTQHAELDALMASPQPVGSEVEEIYGLRLWSDLLERLGHRNAPQQADNVGWDEFTETAPATSPTQIADADRTDGLRGWFEMSADELLTGVEIEFRSEGTALAAKLQAPLAAVGARADAVTLNELASALAPLTDKAFRLPAFIPFLTAPGRLVDLVEQVLIDSAESRRGLLADCFPLPSDRLLPWHPDHAMGAEHTSMRHYQSLARYRHQMSAAMTTIVTRHRRALWTRLVQKASKPDRMMAEIPDIPAWSHGAHRPGAAAVELQLGSLRGILRTWPV